MTVLIAVAGKLIEKSFSVLKGPVVSKACVQSELFSSFPIFIMHLYNDQIELKHQAHPS